MPTGLRVPVTESLVFVAGLFLVGCGAQSVGKGANASEGVGSGEREAPLRGKSQPIELSRLMGANKRAVAELLGTPALCRMESRGEGCAYGQSTEPGQVTEIFFINGRAANLTLPNYGLSFEPASLQAYGIDAGEPVFNSPAVLRWHTVIGSIPVEVDMFPGEQGRISYLYVMTRE